MSVFYRLHQDQSTGTKRSGKWYARAVSTAVISTVKRSDVMAVLEELVEVMKDQMQDSKRVKLDGFGSFKIAMQSKGAQTAGKFSVAEHVKGLRVLFLPERSTDSSGNRIKQFLQGARVEELPLNTVVKEEQEP